MPHVRIDLAAGRTPEQLREMMSAVHAAIRDSIGAADSSITVVVTEFDKNKWQSAGETLAERAARG